MENKRIIKKTGLYFIGNLSSKLLASLLVPLYAFYISTGDLGQFDYSQTVMNIVNPIIFICIWEAILRFLLTENDVNRENRILATSSLFSVLMSILLTIGIVIYYTFIIKDTTYMIYIIGLFVCHGFSNIWQYYARALKQNKLYVISGVLSTIINFSFNILLICVFHMKLEALYISNILANLSIVILNEFKLRILKKISLKNLDFHLLKDMLKFSAPMVINTIATWLISGVGRMLINNILGKEANGLYAFANKFSIIVTFIGTVLNMAVIEESILISKEKDFDSKFSSNIQFTYTKFLSLITLAIPAIMIFYEIIQSTGYYESRIYVPFLLIYAVTMTMSTNIGAVFHAISKTKYIFVSTVFGAIFMIAISLSLISQVGILGVILGQLSAAFAIMFSRYKIARKVYQIKFKVEKHFMLDGFLYINYIFMC